MKKIVTIMLAAMLMLSCMAGFAIAAEAGDTVTVQFTVTGNPGFATYGAKIEYDDSALKLESIEAGALSATGFFQGTAATGKVGYANTANVTGDGVLFTATFTVKEDAVPGTYAVTAVLDEASTANIDGEFVAFEIIGGEVVVEAPECEHQWGEWVETKAPTCTEVGEETRTCSVCGETETREVAAAGHNFGGEWQYDDAQHWYVCTVCGEECGHEAHTWIDGICFCGHENKGPAPTGDIAMIVLALAAVSGTGLVTLTGKKKEN